MLLVCVRLAVQILYLFPAFDQFRVVIVKKKLTSVFYVCPVIEDKFCHGIAKAFVEPLACGL